MNIGILRDTETIRYAAEEFAKYLNMMDGTKCEITVGEGDITLGILSDLSLCDSDVKDAMYDDVIDVKIDNMKGYIAGSNERSILMGVYNFLKSAGCMWTRPGKEGEYIPQKDMSAQSFSMRKKADYAFRGQCIEGSVSYENIKDTVEWLPKINMNLFMMEQIVPYNYMSRWYLHEGSTVKKPENVSFEEIGEYVIKLEKFIKKCGLQLHALGHGYLLEPYGIHYKRFDTGYEINDEAREDVALINGKRELFAGSPNFTQLCFSKDKARLGLVKFLVEYMEKKPYIDFLHVWLSDAVNNHCECEECQKKIPTDFYIQMLNELDAELTKRNVDTKIIFIMYTDTFWPPEVTKFVNPDRFILTTAPSGRNYSDTYSPERATDPLPPFVRNKHNITGGFPRTLQFMDAWRDTFDGPRFLFEYHMYTDHYFDPGYMSISRKILTDTKHVRDVEFDGIMSDQTQRAYFPTALPNAIMGEGLFDEELQFDDYAERYFKASYGEDWKEAMDYLENITNIFDPVSLRTTESVVLQDTNTGDEVVKNSIKNNPETAERLKGIKPLVESFKACVEKNRNLENICHKESWKILFYHGEYCIRLADIYIALANGDEEKTNKLFEDMIDWISRIEDEVQPYLDLVLFKQRIGQTIRR